MPSTSRIVPIILATCLLALPATAQTLLNPSFEDEHDGPMPSGVDTADFILWGLPDHWEWRRVGELNGHGTRSQVDWVTDGDWSLYVFAMANRDHLEGDFLEWYQNVDLTFVQYLIFDVKLGHHGHTESYVDVDGEAVWCSDFAAEYLGEVIDLTAYAGHHDVSVGVRVSQTLYGAGADGFTWFDNLQAVVVVPAAERSWSGIKALFR
jgi:hypothetical protein